MGKIGRNDLCPCGSGKKYKKCCLKKENDIIYRKNILNKLFKNFDILYAKLKTKNYECLEKANIPNYVGANFRDAMDLIVTSNALSLLSSFFVFFNLLREDADKLSIVEKLHTYSYHSITNALNIRNIIECIAILNMDDAGDILDVQKDLFVEQYKLIEYYSYMNENQKNELSNREYEDFVDQEDLLRRYESGKRKFLEVIKSESKLKKLFRTRIPFLCDEKQNYNTLIQKYCPKKYLNYYIALSHIVHPSYYGNFKSDEEYNEICLEIIMDLFDRYDNVKVGTEFTYSLERYVIYNNDVSIKYQRLVDNQIEILFELASKFEEIFGKNNYVELFIYEIINVMNDINIDYLLGYTESIKIKFKAIAEMFACFNKVYFDELKSKTEHYYFKMLNAHTQMKINDRFNFNTNESDNQFVFDMYKKEFPNSKLRAEVFYEKFKKQLGFLIDQNGNVPNLVKLTNEFFEEVFQNDTMLVPDTLTRKEIKVSNYFKMCYKESNNMSHGNGYLFFANSGAWNDCDQIIRFFDNVLYLILQKIEVIFRLYSIPLNDEEKEINIREFSDNKIIADSMKNALDKMKELLFSKDKILQSPKMNKNF